MVKAELRLHVELSFTCQYLENVSKVENEMYPDHCPNNSSILRRGMHLLVYKHLALCNLRKIGEHFFFTKTIGDAHGLDDLVNVFIYLC